MGHEGTHRCCGIVSPGGKTNPGRVTMRQAGCVCEMVCAPQWSQVVPSLRMLRWELGTAEGQALLWVAPAVPSVPEGH